MAKRKTAAKKATNKVADSGKVAATQVANSSPAPAEKASAKKAKAEPKPETRKVCFTDQDTGKRWCGEVTETPKEKPAPKVAGFHRRKRKR